MKRLLPAFLLTSLLIGSAFAWKRYAQSHETLELPTAPVRHGDFAVMIHCRGALAARHSVQLTAPVGVQDLQIAWLAPSGGQVKTGQPVVRFDDSKLKQDLQEKTVALRQAQATLDQGEAQAHMRAEQDKVDLATARYQMERARLEASKQSIVSASEGQKSSIDLRLAEEKVTLQVSAADLHAKSDEAKNASFRRLRDEARAEVSRVEHRLSLMELKSPLNGVVNYLLNTSQGWMNAQPFKAGDHASSGASLAEIPDLSTLQMESKVEEVDRGRINVGDSAIIRVDAFPEKPFDGRLKSISPLTEQSFEEWPPTRTFRAFAAFETIDSRLRPGMNSSADIVETKLPGALSIPSKALFTRQGQAVVYVQASGRFVPTPVKVRARNTDEVAVDGLSQNNIVALVDPELSKK